MGALLLTACARPRGPRRIRVADQKVTAAPVRESPQPPAPPEPAAPPKPAFEVITRAQWGAEPLKDNHDPMERVRRITLHHTATLPKMEARTDRDLVKGVQNFHRNTRGWADIGYHWLIGRDGNVYEGRALTIQGAHAGGGNNVENLGISVVGNFTEELPKEGQLATVRLFLEEQMAKYDVAAGEVYGHRDFKPTECPGGALYAWLENFKEAF